MKKSETPVPIEHLIRLQDEVKELRAKNAELKEKLSNALNVKQEPYAWVDPRNPLRSNAFLLAKYFTNGKPGHIPLYTHPAPIPDGMMLVLVEPIVSKIEAATKILTDEGDKE